MPRLVYCFGLLLLLACCTPVLGIPPPEAGVPPAGVPPAGVPPGFVYLPVGAPSGFGYPPAKAQLNPILPLVKGNVAPKAMVAPIAAGSAAAASSATTLPPAVNNLIIKYKSAASAFYPAIPVV